MIYVDYPISDVHGVINTSTVLGVESSLAN